MVHPYSFGEANMTDLQKLELRATELRKRLADIGTMAELSDETRSEMDTLKAEYTDNDSRQAALKIAGDVPAEPVETRQATDREARELRDLRANIEFGRYVAAAMAGGGVHNGPELEYNQHLGLAANYFPMEMLAPKPLETRAARDGDAMASQATWLDRVMAGTAAERLGVSFRTVAPGVATFPATTAGGSPSTAWARLRPLPSPPTPSLLPRLSRPGRLSTASTALKTIYACLAWPTPLNGI